MPLFIDPTGHTNYGIGLCDRCSFKFPLDELFTDPNYPGLRVCIKDKDQYDPWRLPARQTEKITLPFVRPDVPIDGFAVPPGAGSFDYRADSSSTVDGGGTVDTFPGGPPGTGTVDGSGTVDTSDQVDNFP